MLLPEAGPSLVNGAAISVTTILGYTAMASAAGGGGLGSLAIVKGLNVRKYDVVYSASILLVQTILNVMGTLDVLPFTGVTFPFVSNGGSSMISAWGLMAFVKAADTRQNASFAIRMKRHKEVRG